MASTSNFPAPSTASSAACFTLAAMLSPNMTTAGFKNAGIAGRALSAIVVNLDRGPRSNRRNWRTAQTASPVEFIHAALAFQKKSMPPKPGAMP
ncbi:hypothetical protein VTK26DRAFT_6101 [Humicola hyalothermophila]